MDESTDHEQTIFDAARRIAVPDDRRRYVREACGDDGRLRARVDALLRVYESDNSFLGAPAVPPPTEADDPAGPSWEVPGTAVGPYTLVRPIGQGGMGVVFLAEQAEPVRRPVALKLIRPGMGTGQVAARFEAERQALALMDHPHIAKVYDAGVATVAGPGGVGVPFFAMELVDGEPITRYCDARRLTPRQRLELFVPVCQAVQHAHQKGVIHRDIKPTNVLVAEFDGRPVPKVIDFGIAKAAGAKLTDETLRTGLGAVVGTPEYMAPEQAGTGGDDIDTRADVYALGALLYELLTGGPPIRRTDPGAGDLLGLLRAIREDEPPPPSRRGGAAAVRGDLDWIVMRCLEKDRGRRYESAAALARDVGRFLADEPVEARPPSAGYRARKFVRRNRAAVAAAAAVLAAVVAGGGVSAWQAVRATAAEGRAVKDRDAAEAARQAEATQRQRAEGEQQRAEREADVARAVAAFVEHDLLEPADLAYQAAGRRARDVTVRELLDRAAARIGDRFRGRGRTEGAIRHTLGAAYRGLGEYDKAQAHLDRARELLTAELGPDDPEALAAAAAVGELLGQRGRHAEAEAVLEGVVAATRRAGPADDRYALVAALNLAGVYVNRGRHPEAERLYADTLAAARERFGERDQTTLKGMLDYGRYLRQRGRLAAGDPLVLRATELAPQVFGADHPWTFVLMAEAAKVHRAEGRLDEAERLLVRVRDLHRGRLDPTHPDALGTTAALAQVYTAQERYDRAEPLLREVLAGATARFGDGDGRTLTAVNNLAALYLQTDRPAEAEPLFRRAADTFRANLGADNRHTLSATLNRAVALDRLGRGGEAADLADEVGRGMERIGYQRDNADGVMEDVVSILDKAGRSDAADGWRRKWLAVVKARAGAGSAEYAGGLADLGASLVRRRKWAEAEPVLRECLAARQTLAPDAWNTFNTRSMLGGAVLGLGKLDEAEPLLTAGYAGMKGRQKAIPPEVRADRLAEAAGRLADLYEALGRPDEAARWRAVRGTHLPELAPPPRPAR